MHETSGYDSTSILLRFRSKEGSYSKILVLIDVTSKYIYKSADCTVLHTICMKLRGMTQLQAILRFRSKEGSYSKILVLIDVTSKNM